jgi:hypothetical protein
MGSDSSVSATGWRIDGLRVSSGFVCALDVRGDGATIVAESFAPPSGAIDPGEAVTVNFRLVNLGSAATTNLVATLEATGGVLDPSGPERYGVLGAGGGTGTRPFTFRADPSLPCGGMLVATLRLEDAGVDLGAVSFNFTLGNLPILLEEAFDGVAAPALPAGWVATVAAGLATNNWRTVTTSPDTAPNAAFVPDASTLHDVRLDTPVFAVLSPGAQLAFRNNYNTEAGFDGGVLEISVNGGAFVDILAAGGSFVAGGYNRTLSTGFSNPLPGRQAWSGNSNGYLTTRVNLPAAAAGQNVQLRWRFGSDSSVSATGWRIDSINLTDAYLCATNTPPVVSVSPASQSVQYSDPMAPVTISGTDAALDTPLAISTRWAAGAGPLVAGLPPWMALADEGCVPAGTNATCAWTLTGTALTAPGTYSVEVTLTDQYGDSSSKLITVVVTPEDARATYTGPLYVATSSPTSSTATVTLAATVRDISVTPDAAGDTFPGDIRNANVTFVDRDAGNAVLCVADVGSIAALDLQTGVASCNATVNIGTASSATYRVGIVVNRYYTRNSPADDVMVTVAKPLGTNASSAGGYIVLSGSAGLKAGDAGSHLNFGVNAKYNKARTNLQGNANVIVRRTEADGLHVYQVKANSLYSLTVDAATGKATFLAKANLRDVTDAAAPVSLDGNATLQITMDDNGEPGSADTIGITVWNKSGGLWLSSRWNGVRTVEQPLDGGNLVVK